MVVNRLHLVCNVHCFRPAVFRGLAKSHPAFTKWASDEALAKNFGHHQVKVEPQQEERLSDHCSRLEGDPDSQHAGKWVDGRGMIPLHTVPCPKSVDLRVYNGRVTSLKTFLKTYRKRPEYVITQLPTDMAHDVVVPAFVQCGSRPSLARKMLSYPWLTQIYEANLWLSFSANETESETVTNHHISNSGNSSGNGSCSAASHSASSNEHPGANTHKDEQQQEAKQQEQRQQEDGTFSPRMSRSVLHYDQNHGFMCLYSGTACFVLFCFSTTQC